MTKEELHEDEENVTEDSAPEESAEPDTNDTNEDEESQNTDLEESLSNIDNEESEQKAGLKTKPGLKQKLAHLLRTKKRKAVAVIVGVILVAGIVLAIPVSRYSVLGNFVKKNVTILVSDAATKKPVSQATVSIDDQTVNTASDGSAKFSKVPTGEYTVSVSKKYYSDASASYTVPVFGDAQTANVPFNATGRQVEMSVIDKITQKPLAKALIKVGDTSGETDSNGLATIVLPADKKTIAGTITADSYNDTDINVTVAESSDANKFSVVPSGRIAYLSKLTGKINLMSANLDGSDAKVVIEGTGNEKDSSTSQLAVRDWSYVALQSHRASDSRNQLYVVNMKSGDLKTVDAGDVDLQLVGWSGHTFLYEVIRSYSSSVDKRNALKSYNADSGKLTTIDESQMSGGNSDAISDSYIIDGKIVYIKGYSSWSVMSVSPDGSNKKTVKAFPQGSGYTYLSARPYEPAGLYYRLTDGNGSQYFEYEDGAIKSASISDDDFNTDFYPTYLLSPSDNKTFWYEPRDGKNTIFVGDSGAKNPKTLAQLSDYSTYGWYGDDYVLLSKNSSELYVASANESFDKVAPIKVTDYHKPTLTYPGYGAGYGGL